LYVYCLFSEAAIESVAVHGHGSGLMTLHLGLGADGVKPGLDTDDLELDLGARQRPKP